MILHLNLPTTGKAPYKAVIYFPGGACWYQPEFTLNPVVEPWVEAIPKSGRALITPVYSDTFERGGGDPARLTQKKPLDRLSEWIKDLERTIDYLETREDIDTQNIAYIGMSMGAFLGPILAPNVDRIKSLILVSGCIRLPAAFPKPRGLFQPWVKIPTLMLNGRFDYVWPVDTHQKPLFELMGTPPEHKKHVIYKAGHLPLPRGPMLKEILAWLDKYQGPVNSAQTPETS